jgi:hypothetical protein
LKVSIAVNVSKREQSAAKMCYKMMLKAKENEKLTRMGLVYLLFPS